MFLSEFSIDKRKIIIKKNWKFVYQPRTELHIPTDGQTGADLYPMPFYGGGKKESSAVMCISSITFTIPFLEEKMRQTIFSLYFCM